MSDQDPAVRTWQSSIEAQPSTSAISRRLEDQLERLRQDYNGELAARVAAERERDEARAEIARFRVLVLRYQSTDKGLAATEPPVHLLTAGDDHVWCCGRPVAEVDAAHEHTTLNPHAITCPGATRAKESIHG